LFILNIYAKSWGKTRKKKIDSINFFITSNNKYLIHISSIKEELDRTEMSIRFSRDERITAEGLMSLRDLTHLTRLIRGSYKILPKLYIVESIISYAVLGKRIRFLTKWEGYAEPSWEPLEGFIVDGKYNTILLYYCAKEKITLAAFGR